MRTGRQYLDGLVDGRDVWLNGEQVKDVTTHPLLAAAARSFAELYDFQCDASVIDTLSFQDASGRRYPYSLLQPRSLEDLRKRRTALELRAGLHGGMLGRAPDFMNVVMTSAAADVDTYRAGGERFGANVTDFYERLKSSDLAMTHTLLHPQRDRSTAVPTGAEEENAARIVGETDSGFVVRGARMLATLAPFSDEIVVMPSGSRHLPDSDEAKAFAFACSIPVATPGLRLICRTSLTPAAGRLADFPLSGRLDEMDCVVVFDDVLIPWERTFIYREPRITVRASRGGQASTQTAIKDLVKAEFLLGIAYQLAEATNVIQFPNVLNTLAQMIQVVEMVRGAVLGAEANAGPGPDGTLVPDGGILSAERQYFAGVFPQLLEALQTLGAGGLMMTPSVAELEGPMRADVLDYFQAANLDAPERIALYSLARDAAISSFSGRQVLYERFFAGDPWRLGTLTAQGYPRQGELKDRVNDYLARTRALDTVPASPSPTVPH